MLKFAFMLAVLLAGAPAHAQEAGAEIVGRASVIDGDTIDIQGQRIRLHGVDAPEKGQQCFDASGAPWRCGTVAARGLDELIGQSPVSCRAQTIDRYGRTVARCIVRGIDIEAWLVRQGYAFAYRKYSGDYVAEEQEAKNDHRGVWMGFTQPPWEWRKQRREGAF